jgi:kynurenine formamidase
MARLVDLTHPIRRNHWRWPVDLKVVRNYEPGTPFRSTLLTLGGHSFTHVDAPKHFLPGGRSFADLPLDQWCGEAAVVDLSHLQANEPVTAAALERHGEHIRQGDIVLLRTDWPRKCSIDTTEFWSEAPYTAEDACTWLIRRKVKAVGYDYPPDYSIRYAITHPGRPLSREECTTHYLLFPANICVVEYLTNLHLLIRRRVMVYIFPLLIDDGDGSPVRAVAIED